MSRPLYETEHDREREQAVARWIAGNCGMSMGKRVNGSLIDYEAFDNNVEPPEVKRLVEIKCREHVFGQFSTLMISAKKWHDSLREASQRGLPFVLVIEWQCGTIGAYRGDPDKQYDVRENTGRTKQTRDPKRDIESCVFLPISEFKILREATRGVSEDAKQSEMPF